MTEPQSPLPKWTLIVSGLFALMELAVSFQIALSPESVLETTDLTAPGVHYLVYVWASRQFALGVIFAYATWKKSRPMLTLAYLFFLVMFLGDALIGIIQKQTGLSITAVVMIFISVTMLLIINKKKY